MNYIIHNSTDSYSNPNKISFRELMLTCLKSYGIFGHLRDTYITQLDLNNVEDWLWNTQTILDEIESTRNRLEAKKQELLEITDEQLEQEYKKEVDRLEWYNNPDSNYSAAQVVKITNCLNHIQPQLAQFENMCSMEFISNICRDMLSTVEHDLKVNQQDAIRETRKRTEQPQKIPTYEEFKKKYLADKEFWIQHINDEIKSKQERLERTKECNEQIRTIFQVLDEME